ncbi:MAG: Na+/H+ antiporter NhaC family protein [Bacillota bacterium]|nr:Na+/H+ antiporter NhaC family protein [Bacillota bacterium]
MTYDWLCLLPPIAMLAFAIKTKKSFEALIFGSLVAYIILYGFGFLRPWCDLVLSEISNPDNQYILLICGLFGSLIFLLREARGTEGFSKWVLKFCKSERSVLLTSSILGCIIFVDDYLNIMTIGTCMKDVCDKRKVPREALAYVIDSTGAPVCALLPFSTWAVFYAGMFMMEPAVEALGFGSGIETYLHVIPFMFYPIAALAVTVLFSLGIIPKYGPMKKAYERVRRGDLGIKPVVEVDKELGDHTVAGMEENMETAAVNAMLEKPRRTTPPGKAVDFLLPMGILIGMTIYTGDMLIAIITTLFMCLILFIPRKLMTFGRFSELFIQGFADMLPVLAILLASFLVKTACGEMNLSGYVISLVQPYLNSIILPGVVFLILAILTFVTSSFWGIEVIALPIVIPLAVALHGNILLTLAAVVSGGVFGSHACFYSDATVLSSATCEINNLDHAITQAPYAILSSILAFSAYIIAGILL